jgi:hypothetical protein
LVAYCFVEGVSLFGVEGFGWVGHGTEYVAG